MNLFGFGPQSLQNTFVGPAFGSVAPAPQNPIGVSLPGVFSPMFAGPGQLQTLQQTQAAQQQLGQGFASFLGAPIAQFPSPAFGASPFGLPNFGAGQTFNPFAPSGQVFQPFPTQPTSPFTSPTFGVPNFGGPQIGQPSQPTPGFTPPTIFDPFQPGSPFTNPFLPPPGSTPNPAPFPGNTPPNFGGGSPFGPLPGIPLGGDPFFHQNLDNYLNELFGQIAGVQALGGVFGSNTNPTGNGTRGDLRVIAGNRWDGVAPQRVTIHEQGRFSTRQHTDNTGGWQSTEARFNNGEVGKTYTVNVQWVDGTSTQRAVTLNQPGQLIFIDSAF